MKERQVFKTNELTRGPVEQDALRGLDADRLEQLRVAQRELDQLADLGLLLIIFYSFLDRRKEEKACEFFGCRPRPRAQPRAKKPRRKIPKNFKNKAHHLLAHAADVVVPDVVEPLLVLAPDRLPLAEDLGVGRHDRVGARVGLDDLELDGAHPAPDQEGVALADRAVGLEEVGLEEGVEEVARDALDGVVDGEDVDLLAVLDVGALVLRFGFLGVPGFFFLRCGVEGEI